MYKNSYDIVIWGDSLCSLLTAAELSDKGLDVLLLLDGEAANDISAFSDGSFTFPVGGIPDSDLTKNLLSKVGVELYDQSFFQQCQPLLQIVAGRERIDITAGLDETAEDICRGVPEDLDTVAELILDGVKSREQAVEFLRSGVDIFPPHNFRKKISYFIRRRGRKSLIPKEAFFQSAKILKKFDLFEHVASLIAKVLIPARSDNSECALLPMPLCGLPSFSPRKGMKGFKELLIAKLRNNGTDVLETSGVTGLDFFKNRVVGVHFDEKVISVKAFLYGGSAEGLVPLILDSFSGRAMKKILSSHRPSGQWQSIFVALEEDVMPVGMHKELVVEASDGEPLLIQSISTPEGVDLSDGQHLLKVSRPILFVDEIKQGIDSQGKEVPDSVGTSADFEGLALETLKRLIPFLDGRFKVLYGSGERHLCIDDYFYSGDYKPPFNIGLLSPMTNCPNLFLANKELMPILGVEGDFVAAEVLARYLVEAVTLPEK